MKKFNKTTFNNFINNLTTTFDEIKNVEVEYIKRHSGKYFVGVDLDINNDFVSILFLDKDKITVDYGDITYTIDVMTRDENDNKYIDIINLFCDISITMNLYNFELEN